MPATRLRRKGREKNKTKQKQKQKNKQNLWTNGKIKPIQTKSHKEAYTYILTKREKGKKNIYIYIKRKTATKPINKSTNDNKC